MQGGLRNIWEVKVKSVPKVLFQIAVIPAEAGTQVFKRRGLFILVALFYWIPDQVRETLQAFSSEYFLGSSFRWNDVERGE